MIISLEVRLPGIRYFDHVTLTSDLNIELHLLWLIGVWHLNLLCHCILDSYKTAISWHYDLNLDLWSSLECSSFTALLVKPMWTFISKLTCICIFTFTALCGFGAITFDLLTSNLVRELHVTGNAAYSSVFLTFFSCLRWPQTRLEGQRDGGQRDAMHNAAS